YAHTDEGLDYPKSILYLTDVGDSNGPMAVYPHCEERLRLNPLQKLVGRVVGSVGARRESSLFTLYNRSEAHQGFSSEAFRRHFSKLPRELKYNSHFGWDVVPDSALEESLVRAEVPIRGPAGTFAVFDGARLLHRGGMVAEGERIALQVIFSEPASLFSQVSDRLARDAKRTIEATRMMPERLRNLRARVGRTVQRYSMSPTERLSRSIARLLPSLVCVDIGASYYPHPAWEVFRRSSRTVWIAVEPNEKNTAYLSDWHWPSKPRLEPLGLSEHGGEQVLFVTNVDSGSSLLPPVISPNMAHRVHQRDQDYFFPVTKKSIQTKSLIQVLSVTESTLPMVLKLDTQGTELSILRGAEPLFSERRIVGIETEATMLAEPYMEGSGKFWEVCQFMEARGFELLQLKPIEALPKRRRSNPIGRTYLNECDAVFCLKREEIAKQPVDYQLALLGFYVSYQLFEEALSLFDRIDGIDAICRRAGVSAQGLRRLLRG
ncbi:MAG: methyltransferase, FkbM family domain protein, partial [bacterium]|nr:methyltransferase, FkbM family domain protein [bacterium]